MIYMKWLSAGQVSIYLTFNFAITCTFQHYKNFYKKRKVGRTIRIFDADSNNKCTDRPVRPIRPSLFPEVQFLMLKCSYGHWTFQPGIQFECSDGHWEILLEHSDFECSDWHSAFHLRIQISNAQLGIRHSTGAFRFQMLRWTSGIQSVHSNFDC